MQLRIRYFQITAFKRFNIVNRFQSGKMQKIITLMKAMTDDREFNRLRLIFDEVQRITRFEAYGKIRNAKDFYLAVNTVCIDDFSYVIKLSAHCITYCSSIRITTPSLTTIAVSF